MGAVSPDLPGGHGVWVVTSGLTYFALGVHSGGSLAVSGRFSRGNFGLDHFFGVFDSSEIKLCQNVV